MTPNPPDKIWKRLGFTYGVVKKNGRFCADPLDSNGLPQTGGHGRKLARDKIEKELKSRYHKSLLETSVKFDLDVLIAHILKTFRCDSKVFVQFLSDVDTS